MPQGAELINDRHRQPHSEASHAIWDSLRTDNIDETLDLESKTNIYFILLYTFTELCRKFEI